MRKCSCLFAAGAQRRKIKGQEGGDSWAKGPGWWKGAGAPGWAGRGGQGSGCQVAAGRAAEVMTGRAVAWWSPFSMSWGLVEDIRVCLGKCWARVGAPPGGGPPARAPAYLMAGLACAEDHLAPAHLSRSPKGPPASAAWLGVDTGAGWLAG